MNVNKLIILLSMILLLTGCSESKKLSTNQSEDNNQIKYKSKDITINENEKLIYSTKDNELLLCKQLKDGTMQNLFNDLDLNNINFFKLPKRSL